MGNNFVRSIEPINRLIQAHSNLHQKIQQLKAFLYTKKIERFFAKKSVLFYGVLGLNTLCRGCSSHMTFVGLLYPRGHKLEKVCTGYKVLPVKGLNFLKESECRASIQIMLCISYLQIIIFRSIIQFLFVLFPLLLCLHQHILCFSVMEFVPRFSRIYHSLLSRKFPTGFSPHSCTILFANSHLIYWLLNFEQIMVLSQRRNKLKRQLILTSTKFGHIDTLFPLKSFQSRNNSNIILLTQLNFDIFCKLDLPTHF